MCWNLSQPGVVIDVLVCLNINIKHTLVAFSNVSLANFELVNAGSIGSRCIK